METNISVTFKYVAPGAPRTEAADLEGVAGSGIRIPNVGEVVALPVRLPESQGEMEKDYRVVEVRHAFSGFVPNVTANQIVYVYVADIE